MTENKDTELQRRKLRTASILVILVIVVFIVTAVSK
ncbi:hypothetical protein SAMN05216317_10859 [Nitrosomonas eutropha]|uniref:Uncharacterized protein n=1 Tax=Nitrosomonas eutropha TaxID=916 RepID=A0ABX5M4Q9_9PROT|nr:hypothetical protein C8R14_12814 [Nitrosomonas eutropha]SCX22085.1 hypothetical protein SAMN05216379_11814 [Nitrosomonas eutropha]SDW59667.1 hypothetical protein SAMN05216317_10859 [Nitrosomonas eutropha]SEJ05193.1 hypothetical protein SAMN05216318_12214 [Nitrosomonas eutropha]